MSNTPLNTPTNGFPPTNSYSQYQATKTAFTTSQSTTRQSTTASTGSTTGSAAGSNTGNTGSAAGSSGSNTGSQHGTHSTTTSGYNSGFWDYWEYGSSTDYDYYGSAWDSLDYYSYTSPLESSYVQYEMFLEEYLKINRYNIMFIKVQSSFLNNDTSI
jgi:hypothetical protein